MSLETTGVWTPGVWANTAWVSGVWYESALNPIAPTVLNGTRFEHHFSEDSINSGPPADWSLLGAYGSFSVIDSAIGNVVREYNNGAGAQIALLKSNIASAATVKETQDALVKVKTADPTGTQPVAGVFFESTPGAHGSVFVLAAMICESTLKLYNLLNNAVYLTYDTGTATVKANTWYFIRIRHDYLSQLTTARIWEEGQPEPDDWEVSTASYNTATDIAAYAGIASGSRGVDNDFAGFALATDGLYSSLTPVHNVGTQPTSRFWMAYDGELIKAKQRRLLLEEEQRRALAAAANNSRKAVKQQFKNKSQEANQEEFRRLMYLAAQSEMLSRDEVKRLRGLSQLKTVLEQKRKEEDEFFMQAMTILLLQQDALNHE